METISVGDKIIKPCKDGMRFHFDNSGGTLLIHYNFPTLEEKQAFKDKISIRFAIANELIFILVRMGSLNWNDCVYYRYNQYNHKEKEINFPVILDGMGIFVHAMFIDATTGMLLAQKAIGCETDGSRKFIETIKNQKEVNNYNEVLNKTLRFYPTSYLVKHSIKLF